MITFPLALVLATWLSFTWHFLGVIVVLLCLFLIAIILIQDSKGAGLTSAFGAGPGGESLLGARMQKDVARWTAITAGIFGVLVLVMGLMGTYIYRFGSAGDVGARTPAAAESPVEAPGMLPSGVPPTVPPAVSPAVSPPTVPPQGGPLPPASKESPPPPVGGATAPGTPAPSVPGGSATPAVPPAPPAPPPAAGEKK